VTKNITVLGAGSTGHAAAADLALAGFRITLFEQPQYKERLQAISERGGILIQGVARQGFAKISKVTTQIVEALTESDIIIVAVVATRHAEIAELCAPYLRDHQTVLITPGNAGSLIFARKLSEKGVKSKVCTAELEGNLYPCRLVGPAEVLVALPAKTKYIAAFPAKDNQRVVDELRDVFDVLPATNVFETALNSPNVVIHLAGSLLNSGPIELSGGEYYLYKVGLTPSVLKCIEGVHAEKRALFEALGYADRSPLEFVKKVARQTEFPELTTFRELVGPTSLQHRYVREDAATGMSLVVSLGKMVNVSTPLSSALVALASAINQVDYLKKGRTLENLGLTGLNVEELNRFLAEGRN
jgi:opine dehydrogenase